MKLTTLDRRILNRIQKDVPFVKRPWKKMAGELNVEEETLLTRIDILKKKGHIRRISATFNPRKIGFISTLVAVKADSKNADKVAEKLNSFEEVTHNYKRSAEYNVWFTLVAKSKRRIVEVIKEIKKYKEVEELMELPATKLFKIGVKFDI